MFSHHPPLAAIFVQLATALSNSNDVAYLRSPSALFYVLAGGSFIISPSRLPRENRLIAGGLFFLLVALLMPYWLGQEILVDVIWACMFTVFLNLFILPGFSGDYASFDFKKRRTLLLLSGVALGVWVSGSLITVFPLFVTLVSLPIILKKNQLRVFEAFKYLFWGILIAWIPQILWMLNFGDFKGFFEQVILVNLKVYSQFTGFEGDSVFASLAKLSKAVVSKSTLWIIGKNRPTDVLPFFFLVAGFAFVGWSIISIFLRDRKIHTARSFLLLALLLSLKSRPGLEHGSPFFIPALAVFSWGLSLGISHTRTKAVFSAASVIALALAIWVSSKKSEYWVVTLNDYSQALEPNDAARFDFIRKNTNPAERIVGFPERSIMYVLTERLPAIDAVYYWPWQEDWDRKNENANRTCDLVKAQKPRFVWMDEDYVVWDRWPFKEYGKCIHEYITTHYHYLENDPTPRRLLEANAQ